MNNPNINPNPSFLGLDIAPKLIEILTKLNFKVPTPIQQQSIPPAIAGNDVLGIAQTGTGKTLAFGIPMIQRLAVHKGNGLVILPTRELALQVDQSLHNVGKPLGLKTAVLIGGENMNKQIRALRNKPHIIIATPGRLIDHLQQRTVSLSTVKVLVLDEADHMLDMGFMPQIKEILKNVPAERQTMLFSATMPSEIVGIATSYMKLPVRVEVAPQGSTAKSVSQELFFVAKDQKLALLGSLLKEYTGSVLVFSRTKFGAKKITSSLKRMGHTAAEIHSNKSLNQRIEALSGFKTGRYRILVATDIAARGIDVSGIELVINYDLPDQASDYVHRIGRTGRASQAGHAISFATPDQKYDVKTIERLIKIQLPISPLPKELPAVQPIPKPHYQDDREFGNQRNRNPRSRGPRPQNGRRSDRPNNRSEKPERDQRPFGDNKPPRRDKRSGAKRPYQPSRYNRTATAGRGTYIKRPSRNNPDYELQF